MSFTCLCQSSASLFVCMDCMKIPHQRGYMLDILGLLWNMLIQSRPVAISQTWIDLKWAKRTLAARMVGYWCHGALQHYVANVCYLVFNSVMQKKEPQTSLLFQIVTDLSPPYLGDLLPDSVGDRTRYALRRPNDLIMPMYRISTVSTKYGK